MLCGVIALGFLPIVSASELPRLENDSVRVEAETESGRYWLRFSVRTPQGWRAIAATAAEAAADWSERVYLATEDPHVEWKESGKLNTSEGFFSRATVSQDRTALVLLGRIGKCDVRERVEITGQDRLHVIVRARGSGEMELGQFMSTVYLTPDGRAFGYSIPLEFAWQPSLHRSGSDLTSDYFFRSPVVAAMAHGVYLALMPDLKVLAAHRKIPHALDMRYVGKRLSRAV